MVQESTKDRQHGARGGAPVVRNSQAMAWYIQHRPPRKNFGSSEIQVGPLQELASPSDERST